MYVVYISTKKQYIFLQNLSWKSQEIRPGQASVSEDINEETGKISEYFIIFKLSIKFDFKMTRTWIVLILSAADSPKMINTLQRCLFLVVLHLYCDFMQVSYN